MAIYQIPVAGISIEANKVIAVYAEPIATVDLGDGGLPVVEHPNRVVFKIKELNALVYAFTPCESFAAALAQADASGAAISALRARPLYKLPVDLTWIDPELILQLSVEAYSSVVLASGVIPNSPNRVSLQTDEVGRFKYYFL